MKRLFSKGPRRRALFAGSSIALGAATGAVVFAALGGAASGTTATTSQTSSASGSEVASTTPTYNAATIYDKDSPGVVDITVTEAASSQDGQGMSPFAPGGGSGEAKAEGTGFVYDKQGDIVTASHVVSGATAISVRFKDGTTAKATLVGSDPSSDTAVIKVSVSADRLTPLALADSSKLEPGEGVVAIGSPFGYSESISAGIVSAVGRDIEAPNGYTIPNAIQTDAAINHGNSGGPLIDSSAKVVGVNVQIATDGQSGQGANAGVGFAVPSNTVKSVADDLIGGRAVQHAYLGISVGDAAGTGAEVGTVRDGSPAASAGLQSGDVIVSVNGTKIDDASQLTAAVADHQPGDTLHLTVERNGSTRAITVTLGTRPATATA